MFSRVSISVDYVISFTPLSSCDSRTVIVTFEHFTELWLRLKMLVWLKKLAVVKISS